MQPTKNIATSVAFKMWDTENNVYITGDADNIRARVYCITDKDNIELFIILAGVGNIVEGFSPGEGVYVLDLSVEMMTTDLVVVQPKSTTPSVVGIPVILYLRDNNVDAIIAKMDDTMQDNAGTYQFTADALELAPTERGSGAVIKVYNVKNNTTGDPLGDVEVRVTTDSAGDNTIANGRTDQNGNATFFLDAGTVYMWLSKSGYNFSNPDEEVIS